MTSNTTATADIHTNEVTGSLLLWALITIGLGAMTGSCLLDAWVAEEASGPFLALYRSSPLCCLLSVVLESLYGVLCLVHGTPISSDQYNRPKDGGSKSSAAAATTQLLGLLIGVLPQMIQVSSMDRIPYTQAVAACFFVSGCLSSFVSIVGGGDSHSRKKQLALWLDSGLLSKYDPGRIIFTLLLLAHIAVYGVLWHFISAKIRIPVTSLAYSLADTCTLLSITMTVGGFLAFLIGSSSGMKSVLWNTAGKADHEPSVWLMPICAVFALPGLLMRVDREWHAKAFNKNAGFLSEGFRESSVMQASEYTQRCAVFVGLAACGCFVLAYALVNCIEICSEGFCKHSTRNTGASPELFDFSRLQLPQNQFIHSHEMATAMTSQSGSSSHLLQEPPLFETESEQAWRMMAKVFKGFDHATLFSVPYLARCALPGLLTMSRLVIVSDWKTGQGMSIIELDDHDHRWHFRKSDPPTKQFQHRATQTGDIYMDAAASRGRPLLRATSIEGKTDQPIGSKISNMTATVETEQNRFKFSDLTDAERPTGEREIQGEVLPIVDDTSHVEPAVDGECCTGNVNEDQNESDSDLKTRRSRWNKALTGLYVSPTVLKLLFALLVYYAGAAGPDDHHQAKTNFHNDVESEVGTASHAESNAYGRGSADVPRACGSAGGTAIQCIRSEDQSTVDGPSHDDGGSNPDRSNFVKLSRLLLQMFVTMCLVVLIIVMILLSTADAVWNPTSSLGWAGRKIVRSERGVFWLAFAMFNLVTCVAYYLIAFDGADTHDPRWTNVLS